MKLIIYVIKLEILLHKGNRRDKSRRGHLMLSFENDKFDNMFDFCILSFNISKKF